MKSIYTLIPDIYKLVGRKDGWFTNELARDLGLEIARRMQVSLGEEREASRLRISQIGPRCPHELWHMVHKPELAEPLPAPTIIKYTYGHTIEAMAIALAKAAGHEVTGEQDELSVLGVKGHRDCIIDGYIVDVKSANSRSFKKFQDKSLGENDLFGYLDQLDGYMVGSADDDLVRVKDVAFDWAVDKELGKMALYEHNLRRDHILARVADHKRIVDLSKPPPCTCKEVEDGASGNLILDVKGSYSAFKWVCKPNLRCFIFSGGPRYFTRVIKRPTHHGQPLIEVDRHGRRVYN